MELTIEQALQQGIAAHKEGKLQEAERLYWAILQSQPTHPDANHNLGLIAVSVNKGDAALPLFKAALEANPKIEQFWLSYIDALIKEKQFDNATQVIEQAKKQGVAGDKLNALGVQLASINGLENVSRLGPSQEQLSSLFEHYQNGRNDKAEKAALLITQEFPKHQFGWKVLGALFGKSGRAPEAENANQTAVALAPQDADSHYNLGNTLKALGRLEESEASYKQAIELKPNYAEAHSNLGVTLQELGRLDEAEASYKQAIAFKPDYAEAHSNLGNTLQKLSILEEAEASLRQAIALKSDFGEAHYNLGITLKELGRLEEAAASYTQAITLKPDYAKAYGNLGNTLQKLSRLEEAEACLRQAITLKSDYAEAHSNLGNTLKELGRLDEAEAIYRQAIALKSDFALAHFNLGKVLYIKGDKDSALKSINKANNIDPQTKEFRLLSRIMTARKSRAESEIAVIGKIKLGLTTNPFISRRLVEPELIANLSNMGSREMDKALNTPVYGNGTCSLDYDMFSEDRPIIKSVESDLINIIKRAVTSEVYVCDSFFNIYGAGAGIPPHTHLNEMDEDKHLHLAEQKYSLVYYLSVGDQDCSEPGILRLYDPEEEILPSDGMIVIIPAGRLHSAVYGGKKDRIIIGINFYSL
jgi:tetratricopeptide (TPR) repeat protein